MNGRPAFALNRIMQPGLTVSEFVKFAADCGANAVEIRNDLADPSLLGGESEERIKAVCRETGVGIVTVNALQRFNDPALLAAKKQELEQLMSTAAAVGCARIVLCPVNDPADSRTGDQQHADLVTALREYAPLFEKHAMIGLVEPLGFSICSVRFKAQAVAAIAESGSDGSYRIVHDTFHHYLSGETELFPEKTGLIHASGVQAGKAKEDITDDDRLMVDSADIMDNKSQVAELYRRGYSGDFSFEPFSPQIQQLATDALRRLVGESMDFLFADA